MFLPIKFWTKLCARLAFWTKRRFAWLSGFERRAKRRSQKEHARLGRGLLVIENLEARQLLTTVVATALPTTSPAVYATADPSQTAAATTAIQTASPAITPPTTPVAAIADSDLPAMPANVPQATLSALAVAQAPVPGQLNGAGDWGGGFFGNAAANYTTDTSGLPLLHSLPGRTRPSTWTSRAGRAISMAHSKPSLPMTQTATQPHSVSRNSRISSRAGGG